MSLISQNYREQNSHLHTQHEGYGNGIATKYWFPLIDMIAKTTAATSILDYGCGKGALGKALHGHIVIGYDPAVPGRDAPPDPADFVVCADVLEHIEPECLDAVLDDLQRLAVKGIFFAVATCPAIRILPDGRNAHLIQEGPDWWLPKIMARWDMQSFNVRGADQEFAVYALPKKKKETAS